MTQELKLIKNPKLDYNEKFDIVENIMGNDYIVVEWMMGNTCNYSCTYCGPMFNGGDKGWPTLEEFKEFTKRTTDHYNNCNKKVVWTLLGGEPTVWKDFAEAFRFLKEYDPQCVVRFLTNGSRTLRWWEKNAKLFDEVIISWHPESADYVHCGKVADLIIEAGNYANIQTCLYPPLADLCMEATKYLHANSKADSISPKALQFTLDSAETFEYPEGYMDEAMKYEGATIYNQRGWGNSTEDALMKSEFKNNQRKKWRKAYGKMMRFVNSTTGETKLERANLLMADGRNSWEGWECHIGIEALVIDINGKVTSGSSCNHHINHGHITKPDEIVFPHKPIICEYKWCSCIADVEITKIKK